MKEIPDPATPEGREYRRNKIGSSDAAVILGVSPWKTLRQLYDEKLGLRASTPITRAMQRGIDMEPVALKKFCDLMGFEMAPKIRLHPEREWQISSLDGWNEEKKIAVEIKVSGREDHEKALNKKVPEKYIPQLQHHMAVWDIDSIFYFSWHENDFSSILVNRDETFVNNLVLQEKCFWDKLQTFDPPELDKSDFEDISYDNDCKYLLEIYDNAVSKIKDLEQTAEEARRKIASIVGDRNCKCNGYKIANHLRKGNIQYKNIPILKDIDIEKYRAQPVTYLTINKEIRN